jgi:hypothetical protein
MTFFTKEEEEIINKHLEPLGFSKCKFTVDGQFQKEEKDYILKMYSNCNKHRLCKKKRCKFKM